jgi:2-oxoglutarate ferredoxin oxidoreductase subunit gamma
MVSIRFVGFGGQGVVLASTILAEAANIEGKHAAQSQSYSAQVRGDVTRGDVIISEEPIVYPLVEHPDMIVAMDERALKSYWSDGAELMYDSSLIDYAEGKGIDATSIAIKELSSALYANMILIGYLVREKGMVSADSVRRALAKHAKAEENLKAFELGLAASGA